VHVRLHASLFEPQGGDTIVDPDGGRRRRRRRRAPVAGSPPADETSLADAAPALGVRGDPGRTLAASALTRVRVREAIVRRNHQIDRAERAPRRASSVKPMTLVRIDWVRARDTGLKVERIASDTIVVSGVASGCVPSTSTGRGRASSSGPQTPALSIGLDGLLFTERVHAGEEASTCVARWCARLEARYELAVEVVDGATHVRFVRPLRPI